jgi:hypothetical protein
MIVQPWEHTKNYSIICLTWVSCTDINYISVNQFQNHQKESAGGVVMHNCDP